MSFENGDQAPHGVDGRGHIRPDAQLPAVMQTNNGSVLNLRQHAPEDSFSGQFPIAADDSPHNTQQPEPSLCLAEAGPPHAERGAEKRRRNLSGVLDGPLGASQFIGDESRSSKIKLGMRVGMISDLVVLARNFSRDLRQPLDIDAALKKGGGNAVISE